MHHRADEVLLLHEEVERDREQVQCHRREDEIEVHVMPVRERRRPVAADGTVVRAGPDDVIRGEKPGDGLEAHQREQQDHAQPAERIVARRLDHRAGAQRRAYFQMPVSPLRKLENRACFGPTNPTGCGTGSAPAPSTRGTCGSA